MGKTEKLYHLLEASAKQSPDAVALISGKASVTYRQLHSGVTALQEELMKIGLADGDRVGIYSFKSIDFVTAQFAIMAAGAAYLPLDANAPAERNKFIVHNCDLKALIIHKSFYVFFQDSFTIAEELDSGLLLMRSNNQNTKKSLPDLAYILYTSGSTGKPKGVMYTHAAAMEFVSWSSATFKPSAGDRFSSHAPFHFDLSIFDLFVCIGHGASLVLIDEETARQPLLLAELISREKISIWYSTPTILSLLVNFGKMQKYTYPGLRLVLFAGEVFPVRQFIELKEQWSAPEYYNLYGPTETNVCTYYRIPEDASAISQFPIGKCCEHYRCSVSEGNELFISGSGIMSGYWGSDELNEKAFHLDNNGNKWYRTGDLVETDPKGDFIFKGRKDRMVKRNGYRIELQEIEDALNLHPQVIGSAVIASTNEENATVITAFAACNSSEAESVIKMKEYCMKHLPVYMIPNNFIFLKALPQTASNKIDYQQLKHLL